MSGFKSKLKIGAFVGAGHFGQVFEGLDPVQGKVAVKKISRDSKDSDTQWQAKKDAFLKEAQNLQKAKHRNVVQVFHFCEDEASDDLLYVMAFCEGGSLQSSYEAGPSDISKLRNISSDLASGLAALHAKGMLHRDIKPGNLMIADRSVCQLGDFGLVTDDLILGYGSAAGYNDHIAPEVWAGSPTSARTDIWAVGMTIYRMLHGMTWYERSPSPQSLVPGGNYADTLDWLPHVPSDWRRAVRKMLRDDPKSRYQTAAELRGAINGLSTVPAWTCVVTADKITWERVRKTRRLRVEWDISTPKKTIWRAWSEPIGVGITRTLDGGSGSFKKAQTDLRKFFEGQS